MIDRGIYLLEIILKKNESIKVGALGKIDFKSGYYYYIGSAQRNLKKRVIRHLKNKKSLYWHIDYLLEKAEIKNCYIFNKNKKFECDITQRLISFKGLLFFVNNFGSTDCFCNSHLLYNDSNQKIDFYLDKMDINYYKMKFSRSE
ncbi:MAG: GIY-YIG nuclease family protein [Halanaerobiales bacterium]|nr:GIY-YIG nuclease family protein [Halanaerobiales bacterium]